ncbi:hypothetical protein QJQ45_011889 [Haematococcus lacustris]|nr:hypothetical protein QJQ45_011889 [Haematococcus lacustris]
MQPAETVGQVVGDCVAAVSCQGAIATIKCFKCGKRGHYARDCPDTPRDGVGLSLMLPCVVDKHAPPSPRPAAEPALLAIASTSQLDSNMRVWVAVSRASHHITPERSLLHGYQASVQLVPMGMGKSSVQLYAYGKGRVRLAVDGAKADTITMESNKGELVYGLRQAPRAWHARLKEELEQLGFTASAADSCLFTMMRGSSKVLLAVYVDGCQLAVSRGDMGTLVWVKQQLTTVFDTHQLGPVEQFLGAINFTGNRPVVRISRDRAACQQVLSQEQYALSVVDRYDLADSRPRAVPLSTAEQLQRGGVQQHSEGGHSFAEVIGSLQHLAVVSQPDITQAVGVLVKFMAAPTKEHWRVLRGVLRCG